MRSTPAAIRRGLLSVLALLALASFLAWPHRATAGSLPRGVEQILPRGGIPAVFDPVFVAASDADIPDDAWILGIALDGEARAYSLNLLNSHEVVNDRIGEKNFAAVW